MGWIRKRVLVSAAAGAAAVAGGPAALVIGTATPAGAQTVVSTEGQLRTAFADDPSIVLANDITIVNCGGGSSEGDVDRDGPNAAVTLDGQGHTITQTCSNARVLDVGDDSPLTLRNVTITGGRNSGDGGALEVEGGDVRVERSTFTGNCTGDDAGAIESGGANVTLIASTFANNLASGEASAVRLDEGGDLLVVNSTVTNNTGAQDGALDVDEEGSLTTVYSTIVQNVLERRPVCDTGEAMAAEPGEEADAAEQAQDEVSAQQVEEPANIDTPAYASFGTVVALPVQRVGETVNCEIGSPTSSSGFNFSDDDTCGFTNTGAGDRENAGDPGVAALASNGGPTQTRLPQPGSPLLNFIPIPSCGGGDELAGFAVTSDQRRISRPQETGCEIGSVEIEAPVPPGPGPAPAPEAVPAEPRFTG